MQSVAAKNVTFPVEGGASIFIPSKLVQKGIEDGLEELFLSEEALAKGCAAGIVQRVLEETISKALEMYPPPR